MKNYFRITLTTILLLGLILIIGEIIARGYYVVKYTKEGSNGPSIILDQELGFLPAPNYIFNGRRLDISGKSYSVKCSTDSNGFRMYGNPREKNKKKILFLGDSFTHAEDVSDEKTYFGLLKNTLPAEVFAFGCKGYGTLQEYMILDKWVDRIKPDIIIIQFCSNDFINNHYELELRSKSHNNGIRRPYLTENGIIYENPNKFSAIRNFTNEYSRFLYAIIYFLDKLDRTFDTSSVEKIIENKGKEYPYYKESVDITDQLVKKIRLRTPPGTLICAFSADYSIPYYDEFKKICKENEIYFIDGIPQSIKYAEQNGIPTRTYDRVHWNEKGHQIVSYIIESYIKSHSIR